MFTVDRIDSLDLPQLQPYRTMRRQHEHRQQGIFVAEGEKVVRRLLESGFEVVSLLIPEKWLIELEPLLRARKEEIRVFLADKKLLESMTGFSMYQGLLAVGRIPPKPTLAEIVSRFRRPYLFAALDGLSSAENTGAVVRNCAAFGVHALLVSETCSSPFLRRAVRSSMGTVFQLPIIEGVKLTETLAWLRAQGVHCIAAHPHIEQRKLSQANFVSDCCILLGSEGYGISPAVMELCQDAVAIPMAARVDSLNVSAAAAVFLFEANRQRGKA